jgi:hypothetical protein
VVRAGCGAGIREWWSAGRRDFSRLGRYASEGSRGQDRSVPGDGAGRGHRVVVGEGAAGDGGGGAAEVRDGQEQGLREAAGAGGAGLVRHERGVPGSGCIWRRGRDSAMVELELAPATVSLGSLRHDLALAGVVAEIETSRLGGELLTERELRAYRERTGDERFRPEAAPPPRRQNVPPLARPRARPRRALARDRGPSSRRRAPSEPARSSPATPPPPTTRRRTCGASVPHARQRRADHLSELAVRERLSPEYPVAFRAQPLEAPGGIEAAVLGMADTVQAAWKRRAQEQAARERASATSGGGASRARSGARGRDWNERRRTLESSGRRRGRPASAVRADAAAMRIRDAPLRR